MTTLTASIIAHRYATLIELQTVYSYEDALNLYEVLTVRNYNEWITGEEARRK
jgi:hypothetical protein